MDAYEATKAVFSRIQALDPEHAAKIMGLLLIQDHGDKEMIRLAFGPESLLHAVMAKARKDLGLLPPSSGPATPTSAAAAHSPFLLSRQNSVGRCAGTAPSPLSVSSPSSWAPPPVFSRSNSSAACNGAAAEEMAGVGEDSLIMSPAAAANGNGPFFGREGDQQVLVDELQLQEQLAFLSDAGAGAAAAGHHQLPLFDAAECRSPSGGGDGGFFPYGGGLGWPANGGGVPAGHRRSSSVSELCLGGGGSDGLGWKPCLYYARGYCKNGSACRFVHEDGVGGPMEQDMLLRSKSQRLAAAAFPYSPTGSLPGSPSAASKCLSLLLQQQQSDNQRAAAAAAAAALMLGSAGEEAHKSSFMGRRGGELGSMMNMNPGSRQIYLTFPADSTFREEDVSNYFSIYGPVQDVRIPYQQKRMFGFVTFVYPETVKLILAKGNPHFICDARVLVKPYKEKAKLPADKYRKQQQQQQLQGAERLLDFSTGLDAFDLHHLGARVLQHSNSANEMLLRRKLEEQQQAMELQTRRLMGLHLLDLKARSSPSPIGMPFSPTRAVGSPTTVESPPDSAEQGKGSSFLLPQRRPAVNGGDKEESSGEASPNADSDQSAEHNLPDSPFASPTKSAAAFARDPFAPTESEVAAASPGRSITSSFAGINNGGLTAHFRPSALDIPSPPKPYFFPMSRLSSDHGAGAIGM
ncbi:unnamed protein product [Urochloa humidicola]